MAVESAGNIHPSVDGHIESEWYAECNRKKRGFQGAEPNKSLTVNASTCSSSLIGKNDLDELELHKSAPTWTEERQRVVGFRRRSGTC